MHIPNVSNPMFLEAGFEKHYFFEHVKKKVITKQNLEKNLQIEKQSKLEQYGLRFSEKK
jgi:hypothetical protein